MFCLNPSNDTIYCSECEKKNENHTEDQDFNLQVPPNLFIDLEGMVRRSSRNLGVGDDGASGSGAPGGNLSPDQASPVEETARDARARRRNRTTVEAENAESLQHFQAEVARLQRAKHELEAEVIQLRNISTGNSADILSKTARIQELERMLQEQITRCDEIALQIQRLQENPSINTVIAEKLRILAVDLKRKVSALQQEVSTLQVALANVTRERDEVTRERDELAERLRNTPVCTATFQFRDGDMEFLDTAIEECLDEGMDAILARFRGLRM